MGKTLAEKILSENSESDACAGDIVIAEVGLAFLQDGTGPFALKQLLASDFDLVASSERVVLLFDHASPSPNRELSNAHLLLRHFALKYGAQLCDIGDGICHQLIAEGKSVTYDMQPDHNDPTSVCISQVADAVIQKNEGVDHAK